MRRLFPVLTIVAALACVADAWAGSVKDKCPVCPAELGPFPEYTDQGYRRRMMEQHMASHRGGGGSAAGGGGMQDPFMGYAAQVLGQLASMAGEEVAKSLWGDPAADLARAEAIAEERARLAEEARVCAEEEARQAEVRHQALMGMMKRLPGSGGTLKPKRLGESEGELKPKRLGDSPEFQNLMAGLARAAKISQLAAEAAKADDDNGAKLLSEDALRAAEGGMPDPTRVPDLGPCQEVGADQAVAFQKILKDEKAARERYTQVAEEMARRHDQKEAYGKVQAKAKEAVKEMEQKAAAAPPEKKPEEEDKLAKARALLGEATEHEKKAGEDLANLKKETEKLNEEMAKHDTAKRDLIKGLGE